MSYSRGDIYYVERGQSIGSEQRPGRPAIIVSNDKNNEYSTTVEVVYLTTKPKRDEPTHVDIYATGVPSTALCEQIHTVDMQRLSNFCGSCDREEMRAIDDALRISLSLRNSQAADSKKDEELIALRAQLDYLQRMYDRLLAGSRSEE